MLESTPVQCDPRSPELSHHVGIKHHHPRRFSEGRGALGEGGTDHAEHWPDGPPGFASYGANAIGRRMPVELRNLEIERLYRPNDLLDTLIAEHHHALHRGAARSQHPTSAINGELPCAPGHNCPNVRRPAALRPLRV